MSEQLSLHSESGWRRLPRPPLSPQPLDRPIRPKLGTELIEEMQRHMRECVALGTIALDQAVRLYGDWLTQEYN